jgi:hypothetical protein
VFVVVTNTWATGGGGVPNAADTPSSRWRTGRLPPASRGSRALGAAWASRDSRRGASSTSTSR